LPRKHEITKTERAIYTTLVTFLIASSLHTAQQTPAAAELLAARERAYVANFRNDQAGLRDSIQVFTRLAGDDAVAPFAHYYAGWAKWCVAASQFAGGDVKGAIESGEASAVDMRAAQSGVPERHTAAGRRGSESGGDGPNAPPRFLVRPRADPAQAAPLITGR
jgi:hypothetical protein